MTVKRDLPYLSPEFDRHGKERLYVRRNGRRERIDDDLPPAEFALAYAAALGKLAKPNEATASVLPRPEFAKGIFGWLAGKYFASDEFRALDPQSQITRKSVIQSCLAEPLSADDPEPMGNCPLAHLTSKKIKRLRDLKVGLPGAANNRRKYLSAMFGWAIEAELMTSNPARDVRRKKYATNGFHTWTIDQLRIYLERHGPGTRGRLALGLLLFLGVRRGDMVRLGPPMVSTTTVLDDVGNESIEKTIKFVTNKTRYRRLIESEKPILPVLDQILTTSPCGKETFLETSFGKPFTAKGFGNFMRDRCDEAKLPMCSAHGLRKLGATVAAELGASEHQLMAMFDWTTAQQAGVYTRAARRKLLARGSMPLLADVGIGLLPPSKGVH
jgi:integrase